VKRKVLLGYCLILISWAYCASSEENLKTKKSITLGVVEFPPLVIKEPDSSRCHGVAIDATVAILTKMNYHVLVECMPPARLFERVKTGKVDLTINVRGTSALDQNATFIDAPFVYLSIVLLHNGQLADDKSISAIRGYDYLGIRQALQQEGFEFFDMPTSSGAIHLFDVGRTSYLISYKQPYQFYTEALGSRLVEVSISDKLTIPSYFAVSNHSRYKDELVDSLNLVTTHISDSTILESYRSANK